MNLLNQKKGLLGIIMFLVIFFGCDGITDQGGSDSNNLLSLEFLNNNDDSNQGSSTDPDDPGGVLVQQWPPDGFTETSAEQHPKFNETEVTHVMVLAPLPDSFPAHPAECDYLHFLRFRHKNGPQNPSVADRILIAQPGVLEGASAFYNVACNLVTRAYRERRKHIEFWVMDRRSNTLEDLTGLKFAKEVLDPKVFIDYYFRGLAYKGKKFSGFLSPYSSPETEWLIGMGMDQTVKDWNEIITRGIPDQSVRQAKVFLGGHSMGGFITGAYACWDFDGNPETTADAGYNQCRGYFGLDTMVTPGTLIETASSSSIDMSSFLGLVPDNVVALMKKGLFPRFVSMKGVIDPEIMTLLAGLGAAAYEWPTDESENIAYMPETYGSSIAFRFYHSEDWCDFLFAAVPSIEKVRFTNQALLAVFTDDNAMPFSIVRSSFGFFTGGELAEKNFPVSNEQVALIEESLPGFEALTAFFGGHTLALASDYGDNSGAGPLYGWLNYDEIDNEKVPLDSNGEPYTQRESEVTDINDFSFAVGAWPLNFTEHYFPIRLAVDSMFGMDGIVHDDGVERHPVIDIIAGEGPNLGGDNVRPGSPVISGYDHLDVLTAAPVQNNGEPEQVTTHLLNFIFGN